MASRKDEGEQEQARQTEDAERKRHEKREEMREKQRAESGQPPLEPPDTGEFPARGGWQADMGDPFRSKTPADRKTPYGFDRFGNPVDPEEVRQRLAMSEEGDRKLQAIDEHGGSIDPGYLPSPNHASRVDLVSDPTEGGRRPFAKARKRGE